MSDIAQWALSFVILSIIGLIIVWDARVTRKEERERDEQDLGK